MKMKVVTVMMRIILAVVVVVVVMIEVGIVVQLGEIKIQIVETNTIIQKKIMNVVIIEIEIRIPMNQIIRDVHPIITTIVSIPNPILDNHNEAWHDEHYQLKKKSQIDFNYRINSAC
jgi:hypothetical protein